jgi:hypothetical protein
MRHIPSRSFSIVSKNVKTGSTKTSVKDVTRYPRTANVSTRKEISMTYQFRSQQERQGFASGLLEANDILTGCREKYKKGSHLYDAFTVAIQDVQKARGEALSTAVEVKES